VCSSDLFVAPNVDELYWERRPGFEIEMTEKLCLSLCIILQPLINEFRTRELDSSKSGSENGAIGSVKVIQAARNQQ
jgi:hypothetical protein